MRRSEAETPSRLHEGICTPMQKALAMAPAFRPADLSVAVVPQVIVAQPGDGIRYVLVITPIVDQEAADALGVIPGSWVVAHAPGLGVHSGAFFVAPETHVAPTYVGEKLGVSAQAARVISQILLTLRESRPEEL